MSEKTEAPTAKPKKKPSYIGCAVPEPFALRWKAYCEISGKGKRIAICGALEKAVIDFENKVVEKDKRLAMGYDALLESKAKKANISVNQMKAELVIPPYIPGRKKK